MNNKEMKHMRSYILGVTPRLAVEDNVEKAFINQRYLRPFNESNIIPIMLPLENDYLDEILSKCDGFLVTGGTDIDPTHYNETNEEQLSKGIDARLDTIDKIVVTYAYQHKLPLLGICRGHQAINVFLGGSLHQDLKELTKDHQKIVQGQKVMVVDGVFFKRLLPTQFEINSYHHQAVKALAPDMIASIISNDGVVEAIEHKHLPIISVQWHPEINAKSDVSTLIFNQFIQMIKKESTK
jgi:putative glutamine amidotransferase